MFRIDVPTVSTTLGAPGAVGTPGYWTNGNPNTGTPATVMDADWFNMIQEEIANVVLNAGETLTKTNRTQLLAAVKTLIQQGSGGYSTFLAVTGATTFTAAQSGAIVEAKGTAAYTITLPDPATCFAQSFTIVNETSNTGGSIVTINSAAGGFYGNASFTSGSVSANIQTFFGTAVSLVSDGVNWLVVFAHVNLPENVTQSQGASIATGFNQTLTTTFVAPCNGYLLVQGALNLSNVATGGGNISCTLAVNGATVSSDNSALSQHHMGELAIAAGTTVNLTFNVTAAGTVAAQNGTFRTSFVFTPR